MFGISRAFTAIDAWEAIIAKKVGEKIPRLDDKEESRAKRYRFRLMVITIGLLYNVFAVVFKTVAISLFVVMRFIVPVIYVFFCAILGISSTVTTYYNIATPDNILTHSWTPDVIINSVPSVLVVVFYVVMYISFTYTVGRLYYRSFIKKE